MAACLYKATCKITGKAYIGYTEDFQRRKREHLSAKGKTAFHRAIRKYGPENFIWEIIYESSDPYHTKTVMEPKMIKEHHTFHKENGYNMTFGGEGFIGGTYVHTEETKKHISECRKNFLNNNPEAIKAIQKSNSTRILSNETKRKMSSAAKNRIHSEESKRKLSKIFSGSGNPRAKKFLVTFPDGHNELINDRKGFSEEHGLNYDSVRATNKGKYYKGYLFTEI